MIPRTLSTPPQDSSSLSWFTTPLLPLPALGLSEPVLYYPASNVSCHRKSRIPKFFFIFWTSISMRLCYNLFYDKILYIPTCPKTLGLCLEFRNVPYQWDLYSFRLFVEVLLQHFAPTEVCLSWKAFPLYLSQEMGDCFISPESS